MNDWNRIPRVGMMIFELVDGQSVTFTAMDVDSQMKFRKPKSVAQWLAITRPEMVVPAFLKSNLNRMNKDRSAHSLAQIQARTKLFVCHSNETFVLLEWNNYVRDMARCIAWDHRCYRNGWKIFEKEIKTLIWRNEIYRWTSHSSALWAGLRRKYGERRMRNRRIVSLRESFTSFVWILRSNVRLVSLKSTRSNSSKPESSKQSSSKPLVPSMNKKVQL